MGLRCMSFMIFKLFEKPFMFKKKMKKLTRARQIHLRDGRKSHSVPKRIKRHSLDVDTDCQKAENLKQNILITDH